MKPELDFTKGLGIVQVSVVPLVNEYCHDANAMYLITLESQKIYGLVDKLKN